MAQRDVDPLGVELHSGVAQFMTSMYGWAAAGLLAAVTCAWLLATYTQLGSAVWVSDIYGAGLIGCTVVTGFVSLAYMQDFRPAQARASFLGFAGLFGASMAWLGAFSKALPPYTGWLALAVAGLVVGLAVYGNRTRRDLSDWGVLLLVCLLGGSVALFIDIFVLWDARVMSLHVATHAFLTLVFAGFIAHDTQRIRQVYRTGGSRNNLALLGAIKMYISIINMMLTSLHLLLICL